MDGLESSLLQQQSTVGVPDYLAQGRHLRIPLEMTQYVAVVNNCRSYGTHEH
jgi:hypothetical protein